MDSESCISRQKISPNLELGWAGIPERNLIISDKISKIKTKTILIKTILHASFYWSMRPTTLRRASARSFSSGMARAASKAFGMKDLS